MKEPKKIFLTGANGLLGQKVIEVFRNESEHKLILSDLHDKAEDSRGFDYFQMDITKKEDVKEAVKKFNPQIIINTAAYTNVDGCETERELSWRVNVDAVKNFIIASRINSSKVIHISTDYVFDGRTGNYDENSKPNPLSYYGKSKLASENALITSGINCSIVRTMILYGSGKNIRPNFALWLIDSLEKRLLVKIVDDQFGMPTISDDLAWGILKIVDLDKSGIYHICGSEYLSRYEFAVRLANIFGFDENLIMPIKTSDLNQAAARPMNSSFILLKAETDLNIKPLNVTDGLYLLKSLLGL
ncbi:MAG: dTDP-4-dehydrorhamnose reductase [Chlorobi bacterium]|nr:dTDP-4-dehydrorhamnose reductase [Chlorobiota bacterium]MCI0715250.1 dTDP-4-dehydrorhamnose reductase [Chlorobiota bacterium]